MYIPPSGDFPSGCDVGRARDRDRHGWQRRRGRSDVRIRHPPRLYAGGPGPLVASRISISCTQFQAAVQKSEALKNLIVNYNEVLVAQIQQTAARLKASPDRIGLNISAYAVRSCDTFGQMSPKALCPTPGNRQRFFGGARSAAHMSCAPLMVSLTVLHDTLHT
jgi:hypothetical protein